MRVRLLVALLLALGQAGAGPIMISGGRQPPAGSDLPAWFEGQTSKTWLAIDTQMSDEDPCSTNDCAYTGTDGQDAVMNVWTTCSASATTIYCGPNGGHLAYAGNELYGVNVFVAMPVWDMVVAPSTSVQQNVEYYADGKPSSAHNGDMATFIPDSEISGGRHFIPFMWSVYGNGGTPTNEIVSYQPGESEYDPQDTFADFPGSDINSNEGCAEWNSADNLVWVKERAESPNQGLRTFDPSTNTWSSQLGDWSKSQSNMSCAIDPVRNCMIATDGAALFTLDLSSPTTSPVDLTPSGSGPSATGPGVEYDPIFEGFLVHGDSGATIYTLKKTSGAGCGNTNWAWGTLTNAGGSDTPPAASAQGTLGKFKYISSLHAACLVQNTVDDLFCYKLPTDVGDYD